MEQQYLTVSAYDQAERNAWDQLSNRSLQAANSEVFRAVGFPLHCFDDAGVWRFGETMHEHSQKWIWDLLSGLTAFESEALKVLNFKILPKLSNHYHQPVRAGNSFLDPLIIGRHILDMFPDRPLKILEIGSGSGYLSWFLAKAGHKVITTDVSQGFYLFQNHLFSETHGAGFVELANQDSSLSACLENPSVNMIHLPWWKYYSLHRSKLDWTVDIIISEGNLCEMSPQGHQYTIHLAKRILNSENPDCFMGFRSFGNQKVTHLLDVYQEFCKAGFEARFSDRKLSVFVPSPAGSASQLESLSQWRQAQQASPFILQLPEHFVRPTDRWSNRIESARKQALNDLVMHGDAFLDCARDQYNLIDPGGADQHVADFTDL